MTTFINEDVTPNVVAHTWKTEKHRPRVHPEKVYEEPGWDIERPTQLREKSFWASVADSDEYDDLDLSPYWGRRNNLRMFTTESFGFGRERQHERGRTLSDEELVEELRSQGVNAVVGASREDMFSLTLNARGSSRHYR